MTTTIQPSLKSDDSRATGKPTPSLIGNIFWPCPNFLPHLFSHWPIINILDNPTWIGCLFPFHRQCLSVTSSSNTIFWLVVSNFWIKRNYVIQWRHQSSTCKKENKITLQNYDFISNLWCSHIIILRNEILTT